MVDVGAQLKVLDALRTTDQNEIHAAYFTYGQRSLAEGEGCCAAGLVIMTLTGKRDHELLGQAFAPLSDAPEVLQCDLQCFYEGWLGDGQRTFAQTADFLESRFKAEGAG